MTIELDHIGLSVADYETAFVARVGDRSPFFFPFRRILMWGRLPG